MKKLVISLAIILVPVILLAWWLVIYDERMESGFPRIEPGMAWHDVDQALGSPIKEGPCGSWGKDPPVGCRTEAAYLSLTGIRLVWLDANRRVVGKVHFKQP